VLAAPRQKDRQAARERGTAAAVAARQAEATRNEGRDRHRNENAMRWHQCPETGELLLRDMRNPTANTVVALLIVHIAEMQPPLQRWARSIDAEAQTSWSASSIWGQTPMAPKLGAICQLTVASGYDRREIQRLVNGPTEARGKPTWCALEKADILLTIADLNGLLSDGTVRVRPNPNLRRETWERMMRERGVDEPYEALT
jgi:hypothetical protein